MKSMVRWLPIFVLFAALTTACGGNNNDGPSCGNGTCEAGEDVNTCSADCAQGCGNGTCDAGESNATCSADCPASTCNNNGTCNTGETNASCPADCPAAACNNNGSCDAGETNANCPADCPAAACNNNGSCDPGETTANCAADCPANACNNNGSCDPGEDLASCPADCSTTDVCTLVASSSNVGTECGTQPQDFCGTGVCASFDAAIPAKCFQACVPGQCDSTCVGQERCLGVIDQSGNPVEIQPGVPQGVCEIPVTGNQGGFDKCGGADGACKPKMNCLAFSQTQPAMCMPQCTPATEATDCPVREGFASKCVITTAQGAPPSNCALVCDPAATTAVCPTGMSCQAVTGGGLCMWP